MNRKSTLLSFLSFLVLAFISCNNEDSTYINRNYIAGEYAKNSFEQIDIAELEFLGAVTPFVIQEEDLGVHIGFVQSARPFYLDLSLEQYNSYIEILQTSKQCDIPVKVYVYKETNDIGLVKYSTPEEIEDYEASKTPSIGTRALSEYIPNETILREIVDRIMSSGINFSYIGDGCYYRAHAMRRIINEFGYECRKFFLYGNLAASNGSCCAHWVYHVAPYIWCNTLPGPARIIDPSMFPDDPVVLASTWIQACKNKSCYNGVNSTLEMVTKGEVYYASPDGVYTYDHDYSKTDATWAAFAGRIGCH